MYALEKIKKHHSKIQENSTSEYRLGQYFCNTYIKQSWPELFYANDERAESLIRTWLEENCYTDTLPPSL